MKNNITAKTSVTISAALEEVWKALITPGIIKKYFFGTETKTDWEPGHPITFEGEWNEKKYKDKGTVLRNEHQRLLQYNFWSSMSGIEDKPENYVIITYELEPVDNNHTELTITQENIPDEKTRDHSLENWKKVLENLKQMLEAEHARGLS